MKDDGRHLGIFSTAIAVGSLALAGCGAPRPTAEPETISLGNCRQNIPPDAYRDTLKRDEKRIYEATTDRGKLVNISVINDSQSQSVIVGGSNVDMQPILRDSRQYVIGSLEEGVVFNFITEEVDDNHVTYTAEITCIN